jgi:hypothetical protein
VFELYNLLNDIGEKNNLVTAEPGRVNLLKALLQNAKVPSENKLFDWSDIEN